GPPVPLRVGPELVQPPRPQPGARGVPALRRPGAGLHGLQPARGGLADREVSIGRPLSTWIPDDASARAGPAPGERTDLLRPRRPLRRGAVAWSRGDQSGRGRGGAAFP